MPRRHVCLGLCSLALATLAALCGLVLPACYDVPKPSCGFRCGPGGACPDDYTCNTEDGRCHLNGSPASLICGTVDAPPIDAPDAAVDAPPDAPPDAPDAPDPI